LNSSNQHIILNTNNLSIGYTHKKSNIVIQKALNLKLKQGSFVCLLGNNGVGKSTLLKTISDMLSPLSGQILLNNKPLNNYTTQARAKQISLVLTEAIPPSNLTVSEIVSLGRQPYTNWIGVLSEHDRTVIKKAMQQTQIEKFETKKLFELSDGQKQRVMIARALTQDTPIIILDEPTAHLDIHYKVRILNLLKNICKDLNKSILIATHEVSFATQLADELWLLFPDKIVSGNPDKLIHDNYLQELFQSDMVSFNPKSKHFSIKNI